MHFNYYMPTRVIFGRGRLKELAQAELPGKKALIVITGGNSMRKFGYLDKVQALLRENGVDSTVFDKVLPNPIEAHVEEAAELARREECDFVIGLGGGSAIDLGQIDCDYGEQRRQPLLGLSERQSFNYAAGAADCGYSDDCRNGNGSRSLDRDYQCRYQ